MTNDQAERIINLLESIDKKLSHNTSPYSMGGKDAAKYLGISYEKLLLMLKNGENIPHTNAGKKLLFRSDSLDTWIKNREIKPLKEEPFKVEPPAFGQMRKIK